MPVPSPAPMPISKANPVSPEQVEAFEPFDSKQSPPGELDGANDKSDSQNRGRDPDDHHDDSDATLREPGPIALEPFADLKFGPYQVLEHVGRGGMGNVFKARHTLLKRIVALKTIRSGLFEDDSMVQRFLREVEVLGQLKHRNIVAAENADRQGDEYYLVMEYVDGPTLHRLVRESRSPLHLNDVCDWIAQAAAGLGYAHRKGIVHRDIKPDNLMLSPDGVIKVLDLGLAKYSQDGASITSAKIVMGTCDYMSPEQWKDVRLVDGRADIYALGCTLYFLCVGRHPFGHKENKLAKMMSHALEAAPSLAQERPDAPRRLEAIYQKMVAKDPDDRFANMEEVAAALREVSHSPLTAPPKAVSAVVPAKPRAHSDRFRKNRRTLFAIIAIVSACLAIALVVAYFAMKPNRAADRDTQIANADKGMNPPAGRAPAFAESIGLKLAAIPAGRFEMGSDKEQVERDGRELPHTKQWVVFEQPKHATEISRPFLMSAHEITVAQFRRFAEEEKYLTDAERDRHGAQGFDSRAVYQLNPELTWRSPGFEQTDDHPVTCVSWNDASAFCQWLSRNDGRKFELPTEAQWEYACRAGTTGRFAIGDDPERLATIANYCDASGLKYLRFGPFEKPIDDGFIFTAPVGRFAPNAWGLHDMHGNVWEWCRDAFDPRFYETASPRDPLDDKESRYRSMRGGSWSNPPGTCRSAVRSRSYPYMGAHNVGFRVIAVLTEVE